MVPDLPTNPMTTEEHKRLTDMLTRAWPGLMARGIVSLPPTPPEEQSVVTRLMDASMYHKRPVRGRNELGYTESQWRSVLRRRKLAEDRGEDTSIYPPRLRKRRTNTQHESI